MNEPRNISAYLKHILDSIDAINQYLEDVDRSEFKDNQLLQDGVIRQLEIIGEAVKKLPETLRNKHPDVPWSDVAGTRDKLIHGYFSVDLETVWLTARDDLDSLRENVEQILDERSGK